jgi:putative membrane protein
MSRTRLIQTLTAAFALLWVVLAIAPVDRSDWLLENVLIAAAAGVLVATRRVLPLSGASCVLLFVFLCLHAVGAHYTYSLVPYDDAVRAVTGGSLNEAFGAERNHYDRVVHFAYGLLLVLPFRELLMLHAGLRGFWSYFLPVDLALSSSALYEIIEWGAAIVYGGDLGAAFLGTQGDEWDAHKDMALAAVGASIAAVVLWRVNRAAGKDITLEWLRRAGAIPVERPPA